MHYKTLFRKTVWKLAAIISYHSYTLAHFWWFQTYKDLTFIFRHMRMFSADSLFTHHKYKQFWLPLNRIVDTFRWFFSVHWLNYNGGSFRQCSHWMWEEKKRLEMGRKARKGRGCHTWRLKPPGKMNQQPGGNVTSIVRACRGKRKWKMQRGGLEGIAMQAHLCPPFSVRMHWGRSKSRSAWKKDFCATHYTPAGGRKVLFWK